MNAMVEALAALDARCGEGCFSEHLEKAMRTGGLVYMDQRLCFIGAAWDPVDGDHEHTLAVMYVHGDGSALVPLFEYARRRGFSHVVWCREVCRGDGRIRKVGLERFEKVCRKCYGC